MLKRGDVRHVEPVFTAFLFLMSSVFFCFGNIPSDDGLAVFKANSTNLDGSGQSVAQPEASLTTDLLTWEVNPTNAYQTAASYTYIDFKGTTNQFPNYLGYESSHANSVGSIIYGFGIGVAPGISHVDNLEADYFLTNYVENLTLPALGDTFINQSFTLGQLNNTQLELVDSDYDNYSMQNGVLFISAANNLGFNPVVCAPGTSYNCISVGAYSNGTYANSVGPTPDNGRCKPDLTANGDETSFSTPMVTGAALVLEQAALRGDGGPQSSDAENPLVLKALLMNGALKTPDWTNSSSSPLDARYGAGVMNLANSYGELTGGKQPFITHTTVSLGAAHPAYNSLQTIAATSAWDLGTNVSSPNSDGINHYLFQPATSFKNASLTLTATLAWNRQLNQSNVNYLCLFLYDATLGTLAGCCTSRVDNVQHIHLNQLPPHRYDLQVWKAGGIPGVKVVSSSETYALTWAWVAPALSFSQTATNTTLTWPWYPAGFDAETTTNLQAPAWSEAGLPPPTLTNGCYQINLPESSGSQFFRLKSY